MTDFPYIHIVPDVTTGVDAAMTLNGAGNDCEKSFRIVSAIAQAGTELSFFITGTTIFSANDKKFYKYNGTAWVENTDIPSNPNLVLTYLPLTSINTSQATSLTGTGDSTLHFHSSDRNRSNHAGSQLASTISDFSSAVGTILTSGLSKKITTYSTLITDKVILGDTTSAGFTITMLTPASGNIGLEQIIKNVGSNSLTISGSIDGVSSIVLSQQYQSVRLVSDGTSWNIIGRS